MNHPKHWENKSKWNFVLIQNDIKELGSTKPKAQKRVIEEMATTAGG